MAIFEGAGVALVTPFNEAEEVDYERLGELIEFQISGGTDAILICGCTGEAATLTEEERLSCIRYTVEKVRGRIPVLAGTGTNSTKSTVRISREAERCGADAVLVITPYYNKCTQNGLAAHYRTVAAAVSVPLVLYNVPSRTGVNLLPETAVSLAKECGNIVAIKEASGNLSQVADLAALADGCLTIYSGNDDLNVPILSLGGSGAISVLSNIMPRETHDMIAEFLNGNTAESRRLQLSALPLIRALFCEVNPIPVKAALNLMGLAAGPLRAPLTELEPEHLERLGKEMERLGLITAPSGCGFKTKGGN